MHSCCRRILRGTAWATGVLALAVLLASGWYVASGPRATFHGPRGPLYALAFSTDGRSLASGGFDPVVTIWDMKTFRARKTLTGLPNSVSSLKFSTDGKTLAMNHFGQETTLWDVATFRQIPNEPNIERPSWARPDRRNGPNGGLRAQWDGVYPVQRLALCDAETDRKLLVLEGHPDQLNDWDFAPVGDIVATGGGYSAHPWPVNRAGDVRIWDVKTGRLLARLDRFWGAVSDVEFSPDGATLAAASLDGKVRLWSVARVLGR